MPDTIARASRDRLKTLIGIETGCLRRTVHVDCGRDRFKTLIGIETISGGIQPGIYRVAIGLKPL